MPTACPLYVDVGVLLFFVLVLVLIVCVGGIGVNKLIIYFMLATRVCTSVTAEVVLY